jgi:hypothetical protein
LAAAIRGIGCEPLRMPRIADTREGLRDAILAAVDNADLVLTTGGVSMGTRDLVKPVLEELGEVHFGRVGIQPGKPLTYATVQGSACDRAAGQSRVDAGRVRGGGAPRAAPHGLPAGPPSPRARCASAWHGVRHDPERLEFHRATVEQIDDVHGGPPPPALNRRAGCCRWWAPTRCLRIPAGGGRPARGRDEVRAIMIHEPESEEPSCPD